MLKSLAQAATFVLKIGSTAILARILEPRDFGLVAMVTAITGILALMKDAGLSLPTVQRATITDAQLSTLFWLNVLVGVVLTAACAGLAPLLARFYHESRLTALTLGTAPGFLLSALGVQHNAILMRQMRFPACAVIDVISIIVSVVVGVGMAYFGYGCWSLVGMSLALQASASLGAWIAADWIPGRPQYDTDIGSMIRLGGALTLNSIIIYVAYNVDKVLLGRYWGAGAVGAYGRAYQLVNIPTENLNGAIGGVALSALSRLQGDPVRLRAYFLKGYSLIVALTVPATIACAVFSQEIVAVLLGPKWGESAIIVRLLAPTILAFALLNPTFWLVFSAGMMGRSLRMAVVIAVLVITAYLIGLPYGPRGVAAAYSIAMSAWVIPHMMWCVHGTAIRLRDLALAAGRPIAAGLIAALVCVGFRLSGGDQLPSLLRLLIGGSILMGSYGLVLLYVMRQRAFYVDLFRSVFARPVQAG